MRRTKRVLTDEHWQRLAPYLPGNSKGTRLEWHCQVQAHFPVGVARKALPIALFKIPYVDYCELSSLVRFLAFRQRLSP